MKVMKDEDGGEIVIKIHPDEIEYIRSNRNGMGVYIKLICPLSVNESTSIDRLSSPEAWERVHPMFASLLTINRK